MIELTRNEMQEMLHESVCKVLFTKINGDERIMYCTLNESMIPKTENTAETKNSKKENTEVQPVYDISAAGWRSFRWDSIKQFSVKYLDEINA